MNDKFDKVFTTAVGLTAGCGASALVLALTPITPTAMTGRLFDTCLVLFMTGGAAVITLIGQGPKPKTPKPRSKTKP
jgi:hypothetical protein